MSSESFGLQPPSDSGFAYDYTPSDPPPIHVADGRAGNHLPADPIFFHGTPSNQVPEYSTKDRLPDRPISDPVSLNGGLPWIPGMPNQKPYPRPVNFAPVLPFYSNHYNPSYVPHLYPQHAMIGGMPTVNPASIDPKRLATTNIPRIFAPTSAASSAENSLEYPASPIQTIDTDNLNASPLNPSGSTTKASRRRRSEPGRGKNGGPLSHRRKMTWSGTGSGDEDDASQQDDDDNLDQGVTGDPEEFAQLAQLQAAGPCMRRERRKLQNRLAQRAFRARSKIHHQEVVNHINDLEETCDSQEEKNKLQKEKIDKLTDLVERLQRENTQLKSQRWAQLGPGSATGPGQAQTPTSGLGLDEASLRSAP